MEPDYYAVLGVPPGAPIEEIKVRYRLAVREHHPDAAPAEAKEAAHARIQVIIAAWTVLRDPALRLAYDERLRRSRSQDGRHRSPGAPGASQGQRPEAGAEGGRGEISPSAQGGVRKKSRVQAVMGGNASPRPLNPRTKLLAMVFDAAQLYHVEGRPDDAARVCRDVLRADPTNAEAAVLLADIYASQNQRAAALDLLERALRLQPSNVLYRSKWEALRHASGAGASQGSRGPGPMAPARTPSDNPWAKGARANSLSARIAGSNPQPAAPAPEPTPPQPEPEAFVEAFQEPQEPQESERAQADPEPEEASAPGTGIESPEQPGQVGSAHAWRPEITQAAAPSEPETLPRHPSIVQRLRARFTR